MTAGPVGTGAICCLQMLHTYPDDSEVWGLNLSSRMSIEVPFQWDATSDCHLMSDRAVTYPVDGYNCPAVEPSWSVSLGMSELPWRQVAGEGTELSLLSGHTALSLDVVICRQGVGTPS